MGEEYVGIIGGQMKSVDPFKTGNGEGKPLSTSALSFAVEIKDIWFLDHL